MIAPAWAAPAPIPVEARVADRAYFVGQEINLQVGAIAAEKRPKVVLPRVADAEVVPTGTGIRQIAADGIGDVVNETNLYLYSFRITPRRAGPLLVPALTVRIGDRSGASKPIRLTIQDVPASGRPSTFTGGVGDLGIDAEARPNAIRLGQDLEYWLRLTGPAARGASRPPDLRAFDRPALGLRVEPMPAEIVADPPSRTFRYWIRPSRAGTIVLPPVRVAAFDPKSQTYQTRIAPAVTIRVVDVPAFDPSEFKYGTAGNRSGSVRSTSRWGFWVALVIVGMCLGLGSPWFLGWLQRQRANPRRHARRLARRFETKPIGDTPETARRVTDALAEFLHTAARRPLGALTPEEARGQLKAVTDDPALGERAGQLVSDCDRARFAGTDARAEYLAAEAREFFHDLARSRFNEGENRAGGKTKRGTLDREN